jgi:myo-inositol-1(or 4)-monophosphatase
LRVDEAAERARYRERLVAAVQEAGALALSRFRGPLRTWTKGRDSIVSEADLATNDLLRLLLTENLPDVGWLSEESRDDPARLAAGRVWVVDPIDGTRAYLGGRDDWSISVALVEAGRPVLACLLAPVTEELFVAEAGQGATLNGVQITASRGETFERARFSGPKTYLEQVAAVAAGIVLEPRVHSLALRLARVAQGRLDAAFAGANGHDWDLAAADLLVHEAGGALTTFTGRFLLYNQPQPVHDALVAAGRDRHQALIDLMRRQRAGFA